MSALTWLQARHLHRLLIDAYEVLASSASDEPARVVERGSLHLRVGLTLIDLVHATLPLEAEAVAKALHAWHRTGQLDEVQRALPAAGLAYHAWYIDVAEPGLAALILGAVDAAQRPGPPTARARERLAAKDGPR